MKILLIASTVVMLTITGFTSVKNKKADTGIPMITGAAISMITVSSITPNTAKISWPAQEGAPKYIVRIIEEAYPYYGYYDTDVEVNSATTSLAISSLKPNQLYRVRVIYSNAADVYFTTHTNHCYVNINGSMKICNGCDGNLLSTCATEPLTGQVTIPGTSLVVRPTGWTTSGIVPAGSYVNSSGIKAIATHPASTN